MRNAARTDANQSAIVSALRDAGASVWPIKLPLDLLVGKDGITALFEVKTLTGKRNPKAAPYTPLQVEFMATWRGAPVFTVTDVAGALKALADMAAAPRAQQAAVVMPEQAAGRISDADWRFLLSFWPI